MEWGNLRNWFAGDTLSRERREMRDQWNEAEGLWRASPLASTDISDFVIAIGREAMRKADRLPSLSVVQALGEATEDILRAEDITEIEARWDVIDADAAVAVEIRQMLVRRRRWAASFDRMHDIVRRRIFLIWETVFEALPESCFFSATEDDGKQSFEVPLIELLEDPADVIERLIFATYDDDTLRFELFKRLREQLVTNLLTASGFLPSTDPNDVNERLVVPTKQKNKSPAELAEMYLAGTPFLALLELPVPFHIPDEVRFEHCHIVGGTGHGKTQLMQRMIYGDLAAAKDDRRSVVVIDSQGDLINKLVRLDLFSPDAPGSLSDRLILIDPADVEFPASLNLFDAHLERIDDYRPVDRERVLNGIVELYEIFFGALLGAELTQKQGVIFKYLARLMLTIPGATIHTLMQLMEDGKPFKPYMDDLEGSARYFFATEFFHPSFSATKKQILRRLWGVLSTPAFERMFAQSANKLDLFDALNDGKIVLINTAKDLLKEEGSQLFGRFFIAMLSQAALERSTVPERERTPTFVYVDEAQEYFDDRIETILNQARKYAVAFHCAHQSLDQPGPRVRAALMSNTSLKCAGGVSARDAHAMAAELRTSSDFIESMRRRKDRTEFAVWLKHMTPHAIRLTVPLGFLEAQPILTEEDFDDLITANRKRYCGTLEDVTPLSPQAPSETEPDETAPRRQASRAVAEPPPMPVQPEPVAREPIIEPASEPRRAPPTPGKGGAQHKYLQQLIKQLAEDRGLRAIIEEAVPSGQVDVGLHQGDLSIACEISVTTTPDYEAQNLAKCLRAGFARVWAVAPDAKRRKAIKLRAEARLGDEEAGRIEFLTTEELIEALDTLSVPEPSETVVKGYRVKTIRKEVSGAEAKERRASIARILSRSAREIEG
jgi:hypothetical protein